MAYKLGIDVGGTKIKAILLDPKNKSHFAFNIPTPKNKKSFLKVLESEIGKIIKNKKISGIGVCLPGIIDIKKGILVKAPYVPYLKNWPAKKFFKKFSRQIAVDNDSRCFLIAEVILGVGRGYQNIIGLAIGTSIGGGIMVNGKIYYGENFGAGEFGHMVIDNKKTLAQLGGKKTILKSSDRSKIIGIGLANLINAFDPEIAILGGGGVFGNFVKINIVRKTAPKFVMSPLAKNTPIVKGKLGENSQAIGAALMVK